MIASEPCGDAHRRHGWTASSLYATKQGCRHVHVTLLKVPRLFIKYISSSGGSNPSLMLASPCRTCGSLSRSLRAFNYSPELVLFTSCAQTPFLDTTFTSLSLLAFIKHTTSPATPKGRTASSNTSRNTTRPGWKYTTRPTVTPALAVLRQGFHRQAGEGKGFPFFKLPSELRNKIYKLTLDCSYKNALFVRTSGFVWNDEWRNVYKGDAQCAYDCVTDSVRLMKHPTKLSLAPT